MLTEAAERSRTQGSVVNALFIELWLVRVACNESSSPKPSVCWETMTARRPGDGDAIP